MINGNWKNFIQYAGTPIIQALFQQLLSSLSTYNVTESPMFFTNNVFVKPMLMDRDTFALE
jgi:hypothetical protein